MECSFSQIKELLQRGIVGRRVELYSPIDTIKSKGMYMGCPGKEMFYSLPKFKETEISELANICADALPQEKAGRYVHLSVFWRYLFGVFNKQGLAPITTVANTREQNIVSVDYEQIKQSMTNWDVFFNFADAVYSLSSDFGKMLISEMKAHRLGDRFLASEENQKTINGQLMMDAYERSYNLALNIGETKNLFNSMFWCSRYLFEAKYYDLYKVYAARFLEEANKHCHSKGVSSKLYFTCDALQFLDRKLFKQLVVFDNPCLNKRMKGYQLEQI